jgi:hypothetical protein
MPDLKTAIVCAAFLLPLPMRSAAARSSHASLQAECHKEARAYWNAGRRRWQYQGGIGTAQRQRFYDCLDRHLKGR